MKIGEILIQEGLITKSQLEEALNHQNSNPDKKIGEILIEKGYLTYDDFENILAKQLEYIDINSLKEEINKN